MIEPGYGVRASQSWPKVFAFLAIASCARPPPPSPPDAGALGPREVTLAEALDGISGEGALEVEVVTSTGSFTGILMDREAPRTVASFVALARGLKPFQDIESGEWILRPFYDELSFHRTEPGAFVIMGDPLGDGRGGPGFRIEDEGTKDSRFDRPGVIAMASAGPGTNGSQVLITERPLPELDGTMSSFGWLTGGLETIRRIARAPRVNDLPREPVTIMSISFHRGKAPKHP
ncbi:MAG: peptidylprolyl isomerase [Deltaproteobacteria bacterium]|nr:peptidylprolyl isomerase [Deltaproteobacteria bacterium]